MSVLRGSTRGSDLYAALRDAIIEGQTAQALDLLDEGVSRERKLKVLVVYLFELLLNIQHAAYNSDLALLDFRDLVRSLSAKAWESGVKVVGDELDLEGFLESDVAMYQLIIESNRRNAKKGQATQR